MIAVVGPPMAVPITGPELHKKARWFVVAHALIPALGRQRQADLRSLWAGNEQAASYYTKY